VVAALAKGVGEGHIDRHETVVCVITGAGLKDTKAVSRLARQTRRAGMREPFAMPSPQIGETKFALLQLLHSKPSYGYELRGQLAIHRRISTASVYQHLTELEGFGMVTRKGITVSKGRERVLYELTKRGSDYLRISAKLRN
jgi:DNA-binding MarR family transcriptional regulator